MIWVRVMAREFASRNPGSGVLFTLRIRFFSFAVLAVEPVGLLRLRSVPQAKRARGQLGQPTTEGAWSTEEVSRPECSGKGSRVSFRLRPAHQPNL